MRWLLCEGSAISMAWMAGTWDVSAALRRLRDLDGVLLGLDEAGKAVGRITESRSGTIASERVRVLKVV